MTSDDQSECYSALIDNRFAGTQEAVREHMEKLQEIVSWHQLDSDKTGNMMIVLGEVLNNIVEHGFSAPETGWISCLVIQKTDRLCVETADNGVPLPPSLLSTGAPPAISNIRDDLPEGGFGWFLIHSLIDEIEYVRTDAENRLSFSLLLT